MSEYQCYEFVALDRPLTAKQVAELRAVSTRAQISPTRFWNEYHWGDLKAHPTKLMERYFDAHLYFSNWGTRRLMLRLPKARIDLKVLKPYSAGTPRASRASTSTYYSTSAAILRNPSMTSRARAHLPRCLPFEQS